MEDVTRRRFMKDAAVGAAALAATGVLSACSGSTAPQSVAASSSAATESSSVADASTPTSDVVLPKTAPTADTLTAINPVPNAQVKVGTTIENLQVAMKQEITANSKYKIYSQIASQAGFDQVARLFKAVSDAEIIHFNLEWGVMSRKDPNASQPEANDVQQETTDINLIFGANSEILETSELYPSFIKKAQEENESEAVNVFVRIKQAEAVHARLFLDAYTTLDTPTEDAYYVCPVCGYVHKGESFEGCPICLTKKDQFKSY